MHVFCQHGDTTCCAHAQKYQTCKRYMNANTTCIRTNKQTLHAFTSTYHAFEHSIPASHSCCGCVPKIGTKYAQICTRCVSCTVSLCVVHYTVKHASLPAYSCLFCKPAMAKKDAIQYVGKQLRLIRIIFFFMHTKALAYIPMNSPIP